MNNQGEVINQAIEVDVLQDTIASLQQSLETNNEGIRDYLFRIHSDLKAMPELLHVLTPEQVSTLVKGIETINGVKIMEDAKPKARTTKAKVEKVSVGEALASLGMLDLD